MRFICLALLFVTPIFAVLPPFAEAKKEIKMILESDELAKYIPYGDVFEQIIKTDEGYLITTNKREVRVLVHYSKEHKIGPSKFTLEFEK